MILHISMLLVSIFTLISDVSGASFSKVFVQNGREIIPVEYVQYGSPSVPLAGPQIAQISAAPVGSVVPVSPNLAPCGTPCVYPGQPTTSFAPIAPPSANYIAYNSPISNVPIMITPNKDLPAGYEYSYIVYDESTGDHKHQRELSDGSVVRGEYSFIQPDGTIREVQYVADDLKGFNAIVKNFIPVTAEETKNVKHTETKDPAPPCHEIKNEPLKLAPEIQEKQNEIINEHQHGEKSGEDKHGDSSGGKEEESHEGLKEEPSHEEYTQEESHQTSEVPHEPQNPEPSHEHPIEEVTKEEHSHNEEPLRKDHNEKVSNDHHEEVSTEPHEEKPSDGGHKEEAVEGTEAPVADANILVPYNDIIRCVQAAINGANEVTAARKPESPLTYIVLNKAC